MKLKVYHALNLTLLFTIAGLDLLFIGLTIYHFVTVGSSIDNAIIYMLCYVLALAFTILEIVNTFFSFKTGSRFVKFLVYDDENKIVNAVMVVGGILMIIALAGMIYSILIFSGLKIAFSGLDRPMIYITFLCLTMLLFNCSIVELFPVLGLKDKSFEQKIKKKDRRNTNFKI